MKKSLLLILSAALLFVGCTKELEQKVTDLTSRVDAVEQMAKANAKAIDELKKCDFITKVEQTASGWTITTSSGKVLALYNGTNGTDGAPGKDGDAFFQNVTIEGDVAVFTLADSSTFNVPFVKPFGIVFLVDEVVAVAGETTEIPYYINGETQETRVYLMADGDLVASVNEKGKVIKISVPKEAENASGEVYVFADNGEGKTSIRTITLEAESVETSIARTTQSGNVEAAIQFWENCTGTINTVSNIEVNAVPDADWIKVTKTKAIEHTFSYSISQATHSGVREGNINVVDVFGNTIQTYHFKQWGTKPLMIGNTGYDNAAKAMAGLVAGWNEPSKHKPGSGGTGINVIGDIYEVVVAVSEGFCPGVWEITEALDTMEANAGKTIRFKFYPRLNANPDKCVIEGIKITKESKSEVLVQNITIAPKAETNKWGDGYPAGIWANGSSVPVTIENSHIIVPAEFSAASGTLFVSQPEATTPWTLTNVSIDGAGARLGQFWGGNVTIQNSTIKNAYASYAMRMYANSKLEISGNLFDTPVVANVKTGGSAEVPDPDDNVYSVNVTDIFTGEVTLQPSASEGKVILDGVRFATIDEAISHASVGSVVELEAGEYDANIKVANGKSITIKAVDGVANDAVVVNGNVEISGSATIKGITLKTKSGVTNNVLTVTQPGDGYNWGHNYFVRIENGASNVTVEDCIIDATAADEGLKSSLSVFWISQAKNIVIKNNVVNTSKEGAYCVNQTHAADVLWEGNDFTGGGDNDWIIRVMDSTAATIKGNSFARTNAAIAIYSDFAGSLVLGDGEVDDNVYRQVNNAISSSASKKDLIFEKGLTIKPYDLVFNYPNTDGGEVKYSMGKIWSKQSVDELNIPDARCATLIGNTLYCGVTGAFAIADGTPVDPAYVLPLNNGVKGEQFPWLAEASASYGFTGAITGITNVDGKIAVCNVTGVGNQWAWGCNKFYIYKYDDITKEPVKVASYEWEDGTQERIGDYLSYYGDAENGAYYVCSNSAAAHAYEWTVTSGTVAETPNVIEIQNIKPRSGVAGLFRMSDNEYILTSEGGHSVYCTRSGDALTAVCEIAVEKVVEGDQTMRTPHLFSLGEDQFLAFATGTVGSSAYVDMTVVVVPVEGTLANTLANLSADKAFTYKTTAGTATSGNSFGTIGVDVEGAVATIGYLCRKGEMGVLEFSR